MSEDATTVGYTRTDPFRIVGPALISFSGGRTSARMLWEILAAHGGTLPPDVHVMFANTGKEREETLVFVRECEQRWNVPITWVEYDGVDASRRNRSVVKYVTFDTAARAGEPFLKILAHRGFLPGPKLRFCTQELKLRPMKWAMVALGHRRYTAVVGLRADEMSRVHSVHTEGHDRGETIAPLAYAGIAEPDILAWWKAQPFDLNLLPHEGNCTLCFMKSIEKRVRIMQDRPGESAWWIEQERWAHARHAKSRLFRPGEVSYARLADFAARQVRLPILEEGGSGIDCGCTD